MSPEGAEGTAAAVVVAAAGAGDLDGALGSVAEGARVLAGAPYGAVGLPGPEPGEFSHFVTAGLSDDEIDAIGPLPRAHGLLGAVLADAAPLRVDDIRSDPRSRGWWPAAHPPMGPLLGVPLRAGGGLVGALYAARGAGAAPFAPAEQEALGVLAARAGPLVRALRRAHESGELVLAAERSRIARDLHDGLSQALFSIGLRADAAARALDADPPRAREHLDGIAALAREARRDLGVAVEGLRPPAVDEDGLGGALTRLAALLDRLGRGRVRVEARALPELAPAAARQAFLVGQEALVNAVRHAGAREIVLTLDRDAEGLVMEVRDDGAGFDPADPRLRARRIGLGAMEERAAEIGGRLEVRAARGRGAAVTLRVPGG